MPHISRVPRPRSGAPTSACGYSGLIRHRFPGLCVRACVRACVRVRSRACVCVCACARACVGAHGMQIDGIGREDGLGLTHRVQVREEPLLQHKLIRDCLHH